MKYFLFYIFVLVTICSNAQQDSLKVKSDNSTIELKKFDTDNLEEYKTDKNFYYEIKKSEPSFLERVGNWLYRVFSNLIGWIFGNEAAQGIMAFIVRIIPYAIVALVLFLLIKFFLKVNTNSLVSGKTNTSTVKLTDDEELINSEDLPTLLKNAIAQKNYRLAIRYYYLLVLQKLSNSNIIDWQQQKTNEDYIGEIESAPLKQKFASGTYLYDFVWYGNFELNDNEFAKAENQFNELTKLIK
ncbi:DUF4129 domain-containing protein [Aureibaculum sp. 2210JD6-5]|uniref:DUF4129 domain-containing protein n=1 Tax=Aureibaculum sp. 2210JD6-5 TaxID=3103957 RepID=UPI002AAECB90|nr:DUF4129 domain-containing protein [Aureibaculum sp. 2210JD6-5]MDY7395046.1 DUF4129 domain-containing protein [Aureibaculum sp. 2210JD6-5]